MIKLTKQEVITILKELSELNGFLLGCKQSEGMDLIEYSINLLTNKVLDDAN